MTLLQKMRTFLDQYQVYEWMPIYTVVVLILPAITHYFQQEYYAALFLTLFSMLRAGYHIDMVMSNVSMNAYHMTYVLSNAAVHFNILATGISYRRDLTSTFMLILAVYESMVMLWRLPALYDRDGAHKDVSVEYLYGYGFDMESYDARYGYCYGIYQRTLLGCIPLEILYYKEMLSFWIPE